MSIKSHSGISSPDEFLVKHEVTESSDPKKPLDRDTQLELEHR